MWDELSDCIDRLRSFASSPLGLAAAVALSLGCGQTDRRAGAVGASAGAHSNEGSAEAGTAGSGGDAADTGRDAVTFDASDCAMRATAACDGVEVHYDSNDAFTGTPALAPCSSFNSFDGCGSLIFSFDARGCAVSMSPGPRGWQQHLSELQHCLADRFNEARWPCLASSSLRYDESCFVP